jgi:hypothetical protein
MTPVRRCETCRRRDHPATIEATWLAESGFGLRQRLCEPCLDEIIEVGSWPDSMSTPTDLPPTFRPPPSEEAEAMRSMRRPRRSRADRAQDKRLRRQASRAVLASSPSARRMGWS